MRAFDQKVVDANPTGTQPCGSDPTLLCFGDDTTPANGLNGVQLANPFPSGAILGEIDRTTDRSTTTGVSLQATNSDQLFGHNNQFVVGMSFDSSVTRFSATAELGTIGPNFVVSGSGIFLGQSGDPVSIGPVSLRTTNQYTGLYALDHLRRHARRSRSRQAAGSTTRGSHSQDQIGSALNGNETFDRFNPIIGGTYKITPELTAYAGYSEANRAPTPLELGCADPARPCIIAAFLVSDPPLKQVVARTVEAGLRGTKELNIGTLGWKLGGFRTNNTDDILAIPSPVLQGFGYFQNVGSTRRQGIEAEVTLKSSSASALRQLCLRRRAIPRRAGGRLQQPVCRRQWQRPDPAGQPDPGNPAQSRQGRLRLFGHRRVQGRRRCDLRQQPVFCRRRSPIRRQKLPSYAVFNVHASYQIDKTFQVYGACGQRLRQSLCDLRHVLRYRRSSELQQWRRTIHRSAFAQPGAAARLLCGLEGNLLNQLLPWPAPAQVFAPVSVFAGKDDLKTGVGQCLDDAFCDLLGFLGVHSIFLIIFVSIANRRGDY